MKRRTSVHFVHGPDPDDVAMLRASLTSVLRDVELAPDEVLLEPATYSMAGKLTEELCVLLLGRVEGGRS